MLPDSRRNNAFLAFGLIWALSCAFLRGATTPVNTHRAGVGVSEVAALVGPTAPKAILTLVLQKHFAAAQAELTLLARNEPGNPEVANLQGVLLLLQGRLPQAQHAFEEVLSEHPNFNVASRNLGITFWHEHHTADAARVLRAAHAANPKDGLTNLYLGQVYFAGRDCSDAVGAFQQSGSFLFQAPVPMFMNVVCDAQTGNTREAADLLKRMHGQASLPPQDLFQFALQTENHGQYRLTFLTLRLLPDDFPDPYVHAFDTALAAYQAHDYSAARTILRKLATEGKATPESLDLLGNVLEDQGISQKKPQLVKDAYNSYRKGIYKNPRYLPNFIDIARLCLKLGNYNLGESLLTRGLAENPDTGQLLLERGMAYAFTSHDVQAASDFSRAKQLDPQDSLPYMTQGILDIQEGKYSLAVTDLRQGVKLSSKPSAWLYYLLAKALYNEEHLTPANHVEMRHALREAIRLDPNFKEAYVLAGLVWMNSKDYAQAERYLETARRLDPTNRHYVYELAMLKKLQHEPSAAAKYFKIFEHLEATDNPARMRKYFIKILVNQPHAQTLEETEHTKKGE